VAGFEPIEVSIDDLSRTGARLRVPFGGLGFQAPPSLLALASRVQEVLGASFEVHLNHRVLGPLLAKTVTLVRLTLPPEEPAAFDIGCLFDIPLSNDETVALGVPLPACGPGAEEWVPRADLAGPIAHDPRRFEIETTKPEPAGPAAPSEPAAAAVPDPAEGSLAARSISRRVAGRSVGRWRAFVTGSDKGRAPILSCAMDELSRESVRVRIYRGPGGTTLDGADPASAGVTFLDRYGDQVGLKIMDGASHLWTGPTRVRGVEVPRGGDGEVLLTLEFARNLTPPELTRLGLA
jgi:hypothetical protein